MVTTTNAGSASAADITLSALQSAAGVQVTIPLAQQSSATATLSTTPDAACPANTDCASYTLDLPGVNPTIGAFSSSGTSYTAGAAGPASYVVEAQAFVPGSGGTPDCSSSDMSTPAQSVTPGNITNAPTLAFTDCQRNPRGVLQPWDGLSGRWLSVDENKLSMTVSRHNQT